MKLKIKIGCRKSKLSRLQVYEVIKQIKRKDLKFEIIGIDTTGDIDKKTSISKIEGTDFFTKEIDSALLKKDIDIAIHSAKDLPNNIRDGIKVAAITKGIDSRDVIVLSKKLQRNLKKIKSIFDLPKGISIGTSSFRRKEQIKNLRKDINIVDIRGTIDERLQLLDKNKIDGLVIAAAGLIRLGLKNRISFYLPFITSPLQGRLAILIRNENTFLEKIISDLDDRKKWGKLYIVGGGPGDIDLITLKAYKILEKCNVILYDELVNSQIIEKFNAKIKENVGKRIGLKKIDDEEIFYKIAKYVQNGNIVGRLKGGDPSLFAHLYEELNYMRRNFINYEIIPGITSVTGAACYSEIPLTIKNKSSYVVLSTAFPTKNAFIPDKDFKGTLVYYMSGTNIKNILLRLIKKGWSEDTPVFVISNATNYNQKIISASLGKFLKNIYNIELPAITIINKNFKNFNKTSWFDRKEKILFTGTNIDNYQYSNLNNEIIWQPLIKLKPLSCNFKVGYIKKFDFIIFTSRHTVKFFFEKLFSQNIDARFFHNIKICSIGKVTTDELRKYGIIPDLQSKFECAEDLIKLFKQKKIKDKKIFYPCSNLTHNNLCKELKNMGNKVKKMVIYNNILPLNIKKLNLQKINKIFFTSPSTVKNFKKIYNLLPSHCEIITIGNTTRQAIKNEKI